jgi:TP901 family phage tail tape measure protein
LGAGIGAAVVGGLASSAIAFGHFQERMNEVFTLLPDLSQSAMGQMTEDVKAFARETGRTTDEVIPALYQAISAGVPPENVFDFLRTANEAAVAGAASTQDSVNLLSAVTKAYGDTSAEAVKKVADLAFTTVKLGQTTYPELAASIGKVTPLAAALGVQQEELFGITATLSGVTGNTAEVMTQQKAVMTALIKTNPQMAAGLKAMGFESGQAAVQSLGLMGTLDGLTKVTGGSTQQLAEMLGSAEALTAVLALTGAQSDVAADKIGQMGEATGSVNAAFKTMDEGVAASGRKFLASLETFGLGVGEMLAKFGPLPQIIAMTFGPGLTRAIGGALGGLAGFFGPKLLALILPPAIASGATTGAAMGGATASTAVAVEGAGVAAGQAVVAAEAAPAAIAAGTTLGGILGRALGLAAALAIPAAILAAGVVIGTEFRKLLPEAFRSPGGIHSLTQQAKADAKAAGESVPVAFASGLTRGSLGMGDSVTAAGAAATTGFATGVETGLPAVEVAAADVVTTFGTAMTYLGIDKVATQTGIDGMTALAAGIESARQQPLDAFATLQGMLKNQMSSTQEAARLAGQLTSTDLAKGLRSKDPAVKAQAIATQKIILERLAELRSAHGLGQVAMDKLAAGMRSKDPTIRASAAAAVAAVSAVLESLKVPAAKAGADAGDAFAAAVKASALASLKGSEIWALHMNSPTPAPKPLPGHHSGAWNIPLTGPAFLQAGEMVIRAADAAAVRQGSAVVTAAGPKATGDNTYNITVPVTGLLKAVTPEDVARPMRRLASLGYLGGVSSG